MVLGGMKLLGWFWGCAFHGFLSGFLKVLGRFHEDFHGLGD